MISENIISYICANHMAVLLIIQTVDAVVLAESKTS